MSCNVTIDATKALARVVFDETSFLGIDYEGKRIGDLINIPAGKKVDIPIYNAAQTGPLTFLISYSGSISYIVSAFVTLYASLLLIA